MTEQAHAGASSGTILHLGELLRHIRRARGISQADIARSCDVHRSTILHFEEHGALFRHRETYAQYVRVLADASVGKPDLQLDQARLNLLLDLFDHAQRPQVIEDELLLAGISLRATRDNNVPALRSLIDQICGQPYPAAIFDALGFVHVANGSLFKLFETTPDAPYYQRWEAWHAFATKIVRVSPVRRAYMAIHGEDLFLTSALYQFFERMQTYQYLFTRQSQALHTRMAGLADQEGYAQFAASWRLVSALQVVPGIDQVLRIVHAYDEYLVLAITPGDPCRVELRGNGAVWYTPVVWHPCGETTARVLQGCSDSRLFFTADFDPCGAFHVNAWPELQLG